MHVQSCCFAQQTYCFFDVLFAVAVVVAKGPLCLSPRETTPSIVGCYMLRPLRVVAQILKPVKLLAACKQTQQLSTARQCWELLRQC